LQNHYEKQLHTDICADNASASEADMGRTGVLSGALTTDYYECKDMPERFNHPG